MENLVYNNRIKRSILEEILEFKLDDFLIVKRKTTNRVGDYVFFVYQSNKYPIPIDGYLGKLYYKSGQDIIFAPEVFNKIPMEKIFRTYTKRLLRKKLNRGEFDV